jgi:methylmalonyl-CoA mutase C-terminal domain/subunit
MQQQRPIRIVLAKPGLDGHNRGIHVISKTLADAGMEVIYLGLRKRPIEIARTAVQEDADLIGLSILSGAHMELVPATLAALRELGGEEIPLIVGGIIPDDDAAELKGMGVAAIFTPGEPLSNIVQVVRDTALGQRTPLG